MKPKNFVTWISLGLFLTSLASVLKFKEEGEAWRYQLSLVAAILFFILLALSLYISLKKKKNN
jgi:hypothetical protein